jgi:hypothetical protein
MLSDFLPFAPCVQLTILFAETNIQAISPERLFNHCLGVSGYVDLIVHGATCTGHKPMEVPVMMLNCIFCSQMVDALAFA